MLTQHSHWIKEREVNDYARPPQEGKTENITVIIVSKAFGFNLCHYINVFVASMRVISANVVLYSLQNYKVRNSPCQ